MWLMVLLGCRGEVEPGSDTGQTSSDPTTVDQREVNLRSGAGDHALDFLTSTTYPRLVIEIDWVQGYAPGEAAVDHLRSLVDQVCDKEEVEVVLDEEIPSQGDPAWTVGMTEDLEVAWRDQYRDPETGTAVLYALYLDGHHADDSDQGRVLGFAYHGSSLAMMAATIADAESSLPLLGGGEVETTVLAHELGHLLGLVDNGTPMASPHRDDEHGAHCDVQDCLMYWAVETDLVTSLLGNGIPELDPGCLADLAAARGDR